AGRLIATAGMVYFSTLLTIDAPRGSRICIESFAADLALAIYAETVRPLTDAFERGFYIAQLVNLAIEHDEIRARDQLCHRFFADVAYAPGDLREILAPRVCHRVDDFAAQFIPPAA